MFQYRVIRIALMTFALGLASVSFASQFRFTHQFYEVTQVDLDNAVFLGNAPRFIATGRGCGIGGYTQGYEADGNWLSEGVSPMTQKEFKAQLRDVLIVERTENAKNRYGEIGLRVITKNQGKNGKEYYEILWYGHGVLLFIDAPILELAREFEESNAYAY